MSEEERRAQILQATFLIVARHGYEGASANRIADQAGVSKGLIWHYFSDKTDLLKQALMSAMASLGEDLSRQTDPTAGVPDRIRLHLRWVAAWARDHPDEYRAMDELARNLRTADGELVFTLGDYERNYQRYEDAYRRAQADGIFRPFDPRVMAVTYQAAIDSMLSYLSAHPDLDTDRYASELAETMLAAMMNPGGQPLAPGGG